MKFFLCDDTKAVHVLYHGKIASLCRKLGIDYEIVSYDSGEEMLSAFDQQNGFSGVVFLGIQLPGLNGIQIAEKLQKYNNRGLIIFLTVSRDHLLEAFDLGVFNYIIKGINNEERFEKVFLKAVEELNRRNQEHMMFACSGKRLSIAVPRAHYFEVQRRLVTIYYDGGTFSFVSTLEKIQRQLEGRGFVRVHRSYLVYLPFVESICYSSLKLKDGSNLPVGRTHYAGLRQAFTEHYGAANFEESCD